MTEQLQLGRAKNAILAYLEKTLYVPKIYIDASWDGHTVDVLAIDRDGAGDVHVVTLFGVDHSRQLGDSLNASVPPLLETLSGIPAQYKYIAGVDLSSQGSIAMPGLPPQILEAAYSPDGLGRVGFLSVDFAQDVDPIVRLISKPERFRAKIAALADQYIQQHTADWEIRA